MERTIIQKNLNDMVDRGIHAVINQDYERGLQLLTFCREYVQEERLLDVLSMCMIAEFSLGNLEESLKLADEIEQLGNIPADVKNLVENVRNVGKQQQKKAKVNIQNLKEKTELIVEQTDKIAKDMQQMKRISKSLKDLSDSLKDKDVFDLAVLNLRDFDLKKMNEFYQDQGLMEIIMKVVDSKGQDKHALAMFNQAYNLTRSNFLFVENAFVVNKEQQLQSMYTFMMHFIKFPEHLLFTVGQDITNMCDVPELRNSILIRFMLNTYLFNSIQISGCNPQIWLDDVCVDKNFQYSVIQKQYDMCIKLLLQKEFTAPIIDLFSEVAMFLIPCVDVEMDKVLATFLYAFQKPLRYTSKEIQDFFGYTKVQCKKAFPLFMELMELAMKEDKNGNC